MISKYQCSVCTKTFPQKSNYITHLNRKFKCAPPIKDNSINDIPVAKDIKIIGDIYITKDILVTNEIAKDIPVKEIDTKNKHIINYSCDNCNKNFPRKFNLERHIKRDCV